MESLIRDIKNFIRYLFAVRPLNTMALITNRNIYSASFRRSVKVALIWRVMMEFRYRVRDKNKLRELVILLMDYYIIKQIAKYEFYMRLDSGRK